jgi:RimJ/RimL family protein N-acetyltransferase/8-oxo-dGTP pyrophosphatase MutT (NUDIX family)
MQSLDEAEALIEKRASLYRGGAGIRWAVTLRSHSDSAIGSVGFYNLQPASRSAEIGYDLHPDYWNRGIATEAVGAAIDHGYSRRFFFPLNRIEALTYREHRASIRVLEKLGFTDEGTRRECGFWKGVYHDLRCFSLLRRDWEALKVGESGAELRQAPACGDPLTGYLRAKVICVFRNGGRILAVEGYDPAKKERFYCPPGGRIEFGERSEDAVRREIREELGTELRYPRLLGILENLFTFDGRRGHEVVFVYDADLADRSLYDRDYLDGRESNGEPFTAVWLDMDSRSAAALPVYPDGLECLLRTAR